MCEDFSPSSGPADRYGEGTVSGNRRRPHPDTHTLYREGGTTLLHRHESRHLLHTNALMLYTGGSTARAGSGPQSLAYTSVLGRLQLNM